MQKILSSNQNITIIEGEATDLYIRKGAVSGVELEDGTNIRGGSVVLTTGTFLNGLIRMGRKKVSAGRVGDFSSTRLAEKNKGYGFKYWKT